MVPNVIRPPGAFRGQVADPPPHLERLARGVEAGDLTARVDAAPLPDEIGQLGCSVPEGADLATIADRAESLLAGAEDRVHELVAGRELNANANIRSVVDHLCRLTDWVALAGQLQWERTWGGDADTADVLELYRLRVLDRADPQETPSFIDLHRRLNESV